MMYVCVYVFGFETKTNKKKQIPLNILKCLVEGRHSVFLFVCFVLKISEKYYTIYSFDSVIKTRKIFKKRN